MTSFFGDFLFACAAVGFLACVTFLVFPWTQQLGFREMPAALWCALASPRHRRALRFLLKARRDADREVLDSLPKGELYVSLLAGLAATWQRVTRLRPALAGPHPGCTCQGCTAIRARARHARYEREFAYRQARHHG